MAKPAIHPLQELAAAEQAAGRSLTPRERADLLARIGKAHGPVHYATGSAGVQEPRGLEKMFLPLHPLRQSEPPSRSYARVGRAVGEAVGLRAPNPASEAAAKARVHNFADVLNSLPTEAGLPRTRLNKPDKSIEFNLDKGIGYNLKNLRNLPALTTRNLQDLPIATANTLEGGYEASGLPAFFGMLTGGKEGFKKGYAATEQARHSLDKGINDAAAVTGNWQAKGYPVDAKHLVKTGAQWALNHPADAAAIALQVGEIPVVAKALRAAGAPARYLAENTALGKTLSSMAERGASSRELADIVRAHSAEEGWAAHRALSPVQKAAKGTTETEQVVAGDIARANTETALPKSKGIARAYKEHTTPYLEERQLAKNAKRPENVLARIIHQFDTDAATHNIPHGRINAEINAEARRLLAKTGATDIKDADVTDFVRRSRNVLRRRGTSEAWAKEASHTGKPGKVVVSEPTATDVAKKYDAITEDDPFIQTATKKRPPKKPKAPVAKPVEQTPPAPPTAAEDSSARANLEATHNLKDTNKRGGKLWQSKTNPRNGVYVSADGNHTGGGSFSAASKEFNKGNTPPVSTGVPPPTAPVEAAAPVVAPPEPVAPVTPQVEAPTPRTRAGKAGRAARDQVRAETKAAKPAPPPEPALTPEQERELWYKNMAEVEKAEKAAKKVAKRPRSGERGYGIIPGGGNKPVPTVEPVETGLAGYVDMRRPAGRGVSVEPRNNPLGTARGGFDSPYTGANTETGSYEPNLVKNAERRVAGERYVRTRNASRDTVLDTFGETFEQPSPPPGYASIPDMDEFMQAIRDKAGMRTPQGVTPEDIAGLGGVEDDPFVIDGVDASTHPSAQPATKAQRYVPEYIARDFGRHFDPKQPGTFEHFLRNLTDGTEQGRKFADYVLQFPQRVRQDMLGSFASGFGLGPRISHTMGVGLTYPLQADSPLGFRGMKAMLNPQLRNAVPDTVKFPPRSTYFGDTGGKGVLPSMGQNTPMQAIRDWNFNGINSMDNFYRSAKALDYWLSNGKTPEDIIAGLSPEERMAGMQAADKLGGYMTQSDTVRKLTRPLPFVAPKIQGMKNLLAPVTNSRNYLMARGLTAGGPEMRRNQMDALDIPQDYDERTQNRDRFGFPYPTGNMNASNKPEIRWLEKPSKWVNSSETARIFDNPNEAWGMPDPFIGNVASYMSGRELRTGRDYNSPDTAVYHGKTGDRSASDGKVHGVPRVTPNFLRTVGMPEFPPLQAMMNEYERRQGIVPYDTDYPFFPNPRLGGRHHSRPLPAYAPIVPPGAIDMTKMPGALKYLPDPTAIPGWIANTIMPPGHIYTPPIEPNRQERHQIGRKIRRQQEAIDDPLPYSPQPYN